LGANKLKVAQTAVFAVCGFSLRIEDEPRTSRTEVRATIAGWEKEIKRWRERIERIERRLTREW
jgi:hypothetical protein